MFFVLFYMCYVLLLEPSYLVVVTKDKHQVTCRNVIRTVYILLEHALIFNQRFLGLLSFPPNLAGNF